MPNNFFSLGEIIKNEPGLNIIRKIIDENDIIADFYKIFPSLEKVAKAVRVEKKILFLKSENAAWRSELKFKEKIIVERINKFFNEERIKGLRFIS